MRESNDLLKFILILHSSLFLYLFKFLNALNLGVWIRDYLDEVVSNTSYIFDYHRTVIDILFFEPQISL